MVSILNTQNLLNHCYEFLANRYNSRKKGEFEVVIAFTTHLASYVWVKLVYKIVTSAEWTETSWNVHWK
jgi:hypothetical protein